MDYSPGGRSFAGIKMSDTPPVVANGFATPDLTNTDYQSSAAVIIPVPYDASASWIKGCWHGPQAIIEASSQLELFDEDLKFCPSDFGIATTSPVADNTHTPSAMIQAVSNMISS